MKTLIFDFDGTIANSFETIIAVANQLAKKYGYKQISKKDIPKLRNKTPFQLLAHFKISLWKLPFLIKEARKELHSYAAFQRPYKSIPEVLTKLKKKKYKIGILTSNSEENVKSFLKKNAMNIFDFIYCGSTIFGKDKLLRKILKEKKLKKEDVIYIGDEIRDIEAAKKVGVKIAVVTWGFNSQEVLQKHHPDFLIKSPAQLITL